MARNELTKSAIEIAALVRRKAVERTDKELAECTPPISKANSEAIMALNVQPNYGGGFSRIEGYECFDGITVPSKMTH